jgi:hypothetical protein
MNTEKKALRFHDRTWSEVPYPLVGYDERVDFNEWMHKNGYNKHASYGSDAGIGITLWDHHPEPYWIADYCTACLCTLIVLDSWQDLIDFLAHVSTTMLMTMLPGRADEILDALCEPIKKVLPRGG